MLDLLLFTILYITILVLIIFLSKKLEFYDNPNQRKVHKHKIPNTAGVALYIYLALIVTANELSYEIENIIVVGSAVVITGFLDDRINLTPGMKLILIFMPASYLIFNGYVIQNLGTYEFINKIELNKFGIIFTFLSVGLLINSYNYIDGIDGLLSGITIIGIIYLIFLENNEQVIKLLTLIIIPLIINLIFNFFPGTSYFKIFTGDSGSLFIGFLMSFLIIFLFKSSSIHPAFLIWTCWYPVYDFLYVTLYRIVKGNKFYAADKIHFHHIVFEKMQNSHVNTFLVISIVNVSIIICGYLIANVGKIYSLFCFFLLFIFFSLIRNKLGSKLSFKKKL